MIALMLCLLSSITVLSLSVLLVPGFVLKSFADFSLAVFLVTLMNFILAPMLIGLNLKIKASSLGIFSFVMNLLLLNISAGLIDEFSIDSLRAAIFGAGLMAFFQVWLDYMDGDRRILTRP